MAQGHLIGKAVPEPEFVQAHLSGAPSRWTGRRLVRASEVVSA